MKMRFICYNRPGGSGEVGHNDFLDEVSRFLEEQIDHTNDATSKYTKNEMRRSDNQNEDDRLLLDALSMHPMEAMILTH